MNSGDNLSVAELKTLLKAKGAKTTGTKQVLIERYSLIILGKSIISIIINRYFRLAVWNKSNLNRKLYTTPTVAEDLDKHEWTTSNNWKSLSNYGKNDIQISLDIIDIWFDNLIASASKIRGRKLGLNRFVDNVQLIKENNLIFVKFECYAEMKKKVIKLNDLFSYRNIFY